jgi:hypothetical protein
MKERISFKSSLYQKKKEKEEEEIKRMIEYAKTEQGKTYFNNQLKRGNTGNK